MKRLKFVRSLAGEFLGFAAANKAWWLLPVVLVLLLVALLIALSPGAVAPLIYTLF